MRKSIAFLCIMLAGVAMADGTTTGVAPGYYVVTFPIGKTLADQVSGVINNSASVTNGGATINGNAISNGAVITITGSGISAATSTNIAIAVNSGVYFTTNYVVITNSGDFTVGPFVANRVTIDEIRIWPWRTNAAEAPTMSTKSQLVLFNHFNRRGNNIVYNDKTNLVLQKLVLTTALPSGVISNNVADPSGIYVGDRYAIGCDETGFDFSCITNVSGTGIYLCSTNLYATTTDGVISYLNAIGLSGKYTDFSGNSNLYARINSQPSATIRTNFLKIVTQYGL